MPIARLAVLNGARNPGRSTLTIGLIASASFLIVALAVFMLVKQVNRLKSSFERPVAVAVPTTKDCSFCATPIPIKAARCPNCTSQL